MANPQADLEYYVIISYWLNIALNQFFGVATGSENNLFQNLPQPVGPDMDTAIQAFQEEMNKYDAKDPNTLKAGPLYDRTNTMYISWDLYFRYNDVTNYINWNLGVDPDLSTYSSSLATNIVPLINSVGNSFNLLRNALINGGYQSGGGEWQTSNTIYCMTRDWFCTAYTNLRALQKCIDGSIIPLLKSKAA